MAGIKEGTNEGQVDGIDEGLNDGRELGIIEGCVVGDSDSCAIGGGTEGFTRCCVGGRVGEHDGG